MSDHAIRHRERTYPPPYPDGWYRVAASRDIRPGEVRQVQCVGERIPLFRNTTDGRVAAVDAFCPHQGANLADGVVKGDRLQCPFHGWQLDGHGRIHSHPHAAAQPLARRHWEAIDYYGMVMMYCSRALARGYPIGFRRWRRSTAGSLSCAASTTRARWTCTSLNLPRTA